ncbi:hypothetical protein [Marinicella litoralis]|nr:hypothetical protein [Marinicella litoralis]
MGDIVKPDFEHIRLGLEDSKKGKDESALKRFKAAARYGNYYAITLISVNYINQKDFVNALAWLKLIDLSRSEQKDLISDTMNLLAKKLSPQQSANANQIHQELVATYGHEAALAYRESWKNRLQFTGSKIRGRVPDNLTIVLEADGSIDRTASISVTGHEIKAQLDQFVYEYSFDIPLGQVILEPVEMLDQP